MKQAIVLFNLEKDKSLSIWEQFTQLGFDLYALSFGTTVKEDYIRIIKCEHEKLNFCQQIFNLLAQLLSQDKYSRISFLKWSDYPIKSIDYIKSKLSNQSIEYISPSSRLFDRMSITSSCAKYLTAVFNKLRNNSVDLLSEDLSVVCIYDIIIKSPYRHKISTDFFHFELNTTDSLDLQWFYTATSHCLFSNIAESKYSHSILNYISEFIFSKQEGCTIADSGFWQQASLQHHIFDYELATAISNLAQYLGVKNITDLGCGPGWYVAFLANRGYNTNGIDGNPFTEQIASTFFSDRNSHCRSADLSCPIELSSKAEIIISLEVGEHIPHDKESVFLENLTSNALRLIILSWGVEGQEGVGHVNCHSNSYIIDKLNQKGFVTNIPYTRYLRQKASMPWFKDSLMAFERL